MRIFVKNIFIFLIIGSSFYFISSCNKDENILKNEPVDLGILRTNEFGQVLGGDTTDWCIHEAVDTFTYIKYFTVTSLPNNIAQLKWVTRKEYHNLKFHIERKLKTDTAYSYRGFLPAIGNSNDSIIYFYNDTITLSLSNYDYRLKMFDIWGNYKYINVGFVIISYPVPNASFGPAYPNPSSIGFKIIFAIPIKDTVSMFIINNPDTVYIIKQQVLQPGNYETYVSNTFNYYNIQKRLYIKCSSLPISDSCRNYGDIQFE